MSKSSADKGGREVGSGVAHPIPNISDDESHDGDGGRDGKHLGGDAALRTWLVFLLLF